ncbi:hypothetical protein H6F32_19490 [Anabaena sp. FACHB-1237]|nr:hypothetical protein [Anabaena sp. FACHB-1237]
MLVLIIQVKSTTAYCSEACACGHKTVKGCGC